jgi:HlyD family secretion protein
VPPVPTTPAFIRDTSGQDRAIAPRPRGRRRLIIAAVALAGAALLAYAWPALQRSISTDASVSERRLSVAVVERGAFERDIAAEGKVVAAVSPTLYAPSGGAVTLRVHAGDTVKKGQVLAVLESPELTAKLAQELSNADALQADVSRAEVEAHQQHAALERDRDNAQIDFTTAENDLGRQQRAFAAGAAAGMQVDHAKDTLEKARIALAHGKAGLGLKDDSLKLDVQAKRLAAQRQRLLIGDLQRQAAELQVRSPVDGQVGQLFVAERANVARDAQLLSVIDLSALEVQIQVAESFARELAVGMPGEISGNGKSWTGRISAIAPEVVRNEVAARLRFDGQTPGQLRQSQRLSVRILLDQRPDVLSVRRGPFVDELGGAAAYVLLDGMAEQRPVRLGARSLDKVEVLGGLAPGDRVVIGGAEAFRGAARVSISR